MIKLLTIALTAAVIGMTAGSAEAGYRYWAGYGVYGPAPYCGYAVRRRGHPSAIEYVFVYRCLEPRPARYWHGAVLRSRG